MMLRIAVLSVLATTASSKVLGAGPEDVQKYTEATTFTCTDGTQTVPWSYVNDDYCDCTDGSDEPGTAACAGNTPKHTFWCVNEGHKGEYLTQSRINDGICDCCDGTDEYATDAGCENNCVVVATVHAKERAEAQARLSAGLAKKAELIAEAAKLVAEKKAQTAESEAELTKLRPDLETAEVVKNTEEAIERSEREEIRKTSEAKRAEHDAANTAKRVEMEQEEEALRAQHAQEIAEKGVLVLGGAVTLLREIELVGRGKLPAGTAGTVVSFMENGNNVADLPEDEDDEERMDVTIDAPAPGPTRALIRVNPAGTPFTFIADEYDVVPAERQVARDEVPKKQTVALVNPCLSYRQTGNCDPDAAEESTKACQDPIGRGISGVCLCTNGAEHKFTCDHDEFTCQHVCESNGEEISARVTKPCPDDFPHAAALGTDFAMKVCYNSVESAGAGSGPCGTWCARDAVWYSDNKCTWGCDCGSVCGADGAEDSTPETKVGFKLPEFELDTGASYNRKEAEDARSAYNTLKAKVDQLDRDIKENGIDPETNFGPENEFLPLKGKCFEYVTPDYTYKLCPFKDIHQGGTNMGKWGTWGKQTYGAWGGQDDLTIMKYENVCAKKNILFKK